MHCQGFCSLPQHPAPILRPLIRAAATVRHFQGMQCCSLHHTRQLCQASPSSPECLSHAYTKGSLASQLWLSGNSGAGEKTRPHRLLFCDCQGPAGLAMTSFPESGLPGPCWPGYDIFFGERTARALLARATCSLCRLPVPLPDPPLCPAPAGHAQPSLAQRPASHPDGLHWPAAVCDPAQMMVLSAGSPGRLQTKAGVPPAKSNRQLIMQNQLPGSVSGGGAEPAETITNQKVHLSSREPEMPSLVPT